MGRCEGRVAGSAWPARFTGDAKIVPVSGIHHPVAVDTKNSSAGTARIGGPIGTRGLQESQGQYCTSPAEVIGAWSERRE